MRPRIRVGICKKIFTDPSRIYVNLYLRIAVSESLCIARRQSEKEEMVIYIKSLNKWIFDMNRERRNEPTITVAPHTLYSTFIFPIQLYSNTYALEENPGTNVPGPNCLCFLSAIVANDW